MAASLDDFLKYKKELHSETMLNIRQKEIELQSVPFIDNIAL